MDRCAALMGLSKNAGSINTLEFVLLESSINRNSPRLRPDRRSSIQPGDTAQSSLNLASDQTFGMVFCSNNRDIASSVSFGEGGK